MNVRAASWFRSSPLQWTQDPSEGLVMERKGTATNSANLPTIHTTPSRSASSRSVIIPGCNLRLDSQVASFHKALGPVCISIFCYACHMTRPNHRSQCAQPNIWRRVQILKNPHFSLLPQRQTNTSRRSPITLLSTLSPKDFFSQIQ
jgi:hypothetical protein